MVFCFCSVAGHGGSSCSQCPAGSWSAGSLDPCTPCGPGLVSPPGSNDVLDCQPCLLVSGRIPGLAAATHMQTAVTKCIPTPSPAVPAAACAGHSASQWCVLGLSDRDNQPGSWITNMQCVQTRVWAGGRLNAVHSMYVTQFSKHPRSGCSQRRDTHLPRQHCVLQQDCGQQGRQTMLAAQPAAAPRATPVCGVITSAHYLLHSPLTLQLCCGRLTPLSLLCTAALSRPPWDVCLTGNCCWLCALRTLVRSLA